MPELNLDSLEKISDNLVKYKNVSYNDKVLLDIFEVLGYVKYNGSSHHTDTTKLLAIKSLNDKYIALYYHTSLTPEKVLEVNKGLYYIGLLGDNNLKTQEKIFKLLPGLSLKDTFKWAIVIELTGSYQNLEVLDLYPDFIVEYMLKEENIQDI